MGYEQSCALTSAKVLTTEDPQNSKNARDLIEFNAEHERGVGACPWVTRHMKFIATPVHYNSSANQQ